MISKNKGFPNTQKALLKILKALTSLPAQAIYYGSALLAIAATGGVDLPPTLIPLVSAVGGNVLANILEHVAKEDQITDDEIQKIVLETIKSTKIASQANQDLLQQQISQMFQQFDLQNYAIREGESLVLKSLLKGFAQFNFRLDELQNKSNEILEIVKDIQEKVPGFNYQSSQLSDQYSTKLINENINQEVERLRKSRFFQEFDKQEYSKELADKLVEGVYAKGNNDLKSSALAWCVRFLSDSELQNAEKHLEIARKLGDNPEIKIAQAFIFSYAKDKTSALSILAKLNTPASRTASLMIVSNCDGQEKAVDWFKTSKTKFSDLDSDGKHFLLHLQLYLGNWEDALSYLEGISEEDFIRTPILNYSVGLTHLIKAISPELRSLIITQLPFNLKSFPISSNADGMRAREAAHNYFIHAMEAAKKLGLSLAAAVFDEYALWLELRNPEKNKSGIEKLVKKLQEPELALRLVPFGLQFGIKMDFKKIESKIEQEIALNGEITPNAAIARFALAFTKDNPEEILSYLDQHHNELDKYLDEKSVKTIKIELLAKAGFTTEAQESYLELKKIGLPPEEENRISIIISEGKGINPIQSIKDQYQKTKSVVDLKALVDSLETNHDWNAVCEYSHILFENTPDVHVAETYINALAKTHSYYEIMNFIRTNPDHFPQSEILQMHFCWALFFEGELLESQATLEKIGAKWGDPNYRALKINLNIALGNWDLLQEILANEYKEKDKRSAQELIGSGQLAFNLGLIPQSKEFIIAATEKGKNDAGILATAYFLASQGGWEDDPAVIDWLYKATELSGNDGPIQRFTLKEIVEKKPGWDRRQSEIYNSLIKAEMPMDLCANALNRSLFNFMLFPAITNLSENDPRRRVGILAYSGNQHQSVISPLRNIGIDTTSLLTLGFLNLFDKVVESYDSVSIPHSILTWLFEEKQKVAFHQPSQIKRAHEIIEMLNQGTLEKFMPSATPNSELSAQVGDELSSLLTETENGIGKDSIQRLVVKPPPIYRLNSLMEEEAELPQYSDVLCSCQSIVIKLKQKGQITSAYEKKALAYLKLHEKPWPNQPEVTDGATLYLEEIAVIYLYEIGVLEKLHSAGLKPVLSPNFFSEANNLISYEKYSKKILEIIENLRSTIKSGIESRKIRVSSQHEITEQELKIRTEFPTLDLFSMAKSCDGIICDDRFFNQKSYLEHQNEKTLIFTTFDIIENLYSLGRISKDEQIECKTKLRRAGYFFVPISNTELLTQLNSSSVENGKVVETLELKAIRENLLMVRMGTFLQLPNEAYWLDSSIKIFIQVLKEIWKTDTDLANKRARSNWVLDQLDFRGWAHFLGDENGNDFIKTGLNGYFIVLLTPPLDVEPNVKDAYHNWADEQILVPIKEQSPEQYHWITEWYRKKITELVENNVTRENSNEK